MLSAQPSCRMYAPAAEGSCTGNGILPYAGAGAMSRYIDRGTFEELLVVNPAEAERALDVIRPLLDEFRTVVPAADLYFIVSHDRQTFANRFEYADVGVERDGVLFLIRRTNSPSKGYTGV